MAHFYGTIRGQRGEASRLGGKASGLTTYAASWQGAVRVELYYNSATDTDMVDVYLTQHRGRGAYPDRLLYSGPVSGAPYKGGK